MKSKKKVTMKASNQRKGDSKTTPKVKKKALVKTRLQFSGSDQQLILSFPGAVTPTGLILHPSLEIKKWSPIGIRLRRVKDWVHFAIGDWLKHGEAHYGEMYTQAASDTGMSEKTLMILKYVASWVAPETRIKDLSWSHHREVAKFPPEEQTKWLEKALSNQWSVRDLKDALNKAAGKDGDEQKERKIREEEPPTGEACTCCGNSPAPMRICGHCVILPVEAISSIGIRGALQLIKQKPSKPQLKLLKWAFGYIKQPQDQTVLEEAEWEAYYEALAKVVAKAS